MGENLEVIREDLWDEAKGSEKVKVTITGEHTRPGNSGEQESHVETTRNEVSGILRRAKGGVILLEYEEALEEGVDIVTFNRVKIKPSSLEISRKGSVDTELVWKEGEDQDTEYKTPYGQMKMHIHTERYQTYQLERGKRIIAEAEYRVRMNGMEMSKALIRLDIRCLDAH